MNRIEVKILNPDAVSEAENMMVAMARLTQRGHNISNMDDFQELLDKPYSDNLVDSMVSLPHPTIQKFGIVNIAVVGASRRFLAQITRHQNEVKFMSGSLQYSDYSGKAQFVVPYEVTKCDTGKPGRHVTDFYLDGCLRDLSEYEVLVDLVGRDAAGYKMPQGMRNVLLISATPYQLKHMIRQRTCNRNTLETQYVMLLIWEQLWRLSNMYHDCGPFCTTGTCPEGKMCCGKPYSKLSEPTLILNDRFKYIRGMYNDYNR